MTGSVFMPWRHSGRRPVTRRNVAAWARHGEASASPACSRRRRTGGRRRRCLGGSAGQKRGRKRRRRRTAEGRAGEGRAAAFKGVQGQHALARTPRTPGVQGTDTEEGAAAAARRVPPGHGGGRRLGPNGPRGCSGPGTGQRRSGPCWWATLGRLMGCAKKSREHQQTSVDGLGPIGKEYLIISRNYF